MLYLADDEFELFCKWDGGTTVEYDGSKYYIDNVTVDGFYLKLMGGNNNADNTTK
jgi:hypothetical protein